MDNQGTNTALVIDVSSFPTLEQLERQYLTMVLDRTAGSKAEAAKILGVSTKTVYNKLDTYKATEEVKETN